MLEFAEFGACFEEDLEDGESTKRSEISSRGQGRKNKRIARRTVLLTVLAYGLVPRMQLRVPRIEALQCPLEPFAGSTHTAHLLQHR